MKFIYFLAVISIISFAIFGIDKNRAKNHRRRISENTLLLLTFFGGTIGSVFAMLIFRHKISKKSFLVKFAVVIAVQILLGILVLRYC